MKLKLVFHPSNPTIITDLAAEFVELRESQGETVHFGPLKMLLLIDGQPYKEVEGELQISEDTRMEMDVGVTASEATLNVHHGEES
jgi:hypothetical protein